MTDMSTLSAETMSSAIRPEAMTLAFAHSHVDWYSPDFSRQKLICAGHLVYDFETNVMEDGYGSFEEDQLVLDAVEGLVVSRFHPALNPGQDIETFQRIDMAAQLGVPIYDLHNSLFIWSSDGSKRPDPNPLQAWPEMYVGNADFRQFRDYKPMEVWRRPRSDIVGEISEREFATIESMTRQGEQ